MDIHVPLPSAVRHYVQSDETMWARIVSFLVSPPLVWAVCVYPIALGVSTNVSLALLHATIFTTLVCWIPVGFIAYMVKIGKIGDLHMRKSHERYLPYALSIVTSGIAGWLLTQIGSHPILLIITLISGVQLTIMLIATFFHHISAHAMAITSVTTATAIVFGFRTGLMVVPVIMIVVLARLVLNRHTPAQIITGTLVGLLTPLAVIALLPYFA